jgi:hypothetical protein
MFILVISVIIYAFYFAVSFAALHYRSYEVFMVGRAILSSSSSYNTKLTRAKEVQAMYDSSLDPAIAKNVSTNLTCDFSGNNSNGFRGIMDYGYNTKFNVSSNAGIACSVSANYILPAVITRSGGNQLKVAVESMTGSEITTDHCECGLDPSKTWGDCLQSVSQNSTSILFFFIDNGC